MPSEGFHVKQPAGQEVTAGKAAGGAGKPASAGVKGGKKLGKGKQDARAKDGQHAAQAPIHPSMAIRDEFVKAKTALAEADARAGDDFDPDHAKTRQTTWSINQLSEDQVSAIEVDYRGGLKSVEAIARDHRIHVPTLYRLSAARGWPRRTAIKAAMISAVTQADAANLAGRLNARLASSDAEAVAHAALLDDAGAPLVNLGTSPNPNRPATPAEMRDQAKQDLLLESYAISASMVLANHRDLAEKAVQSGQTLIEMYNRAIEQVRQEHPSDAIGAARAVANLAKEYGKLVGDVQKAIDMQRQAFALDESFGKNVPLASLAQWRAARAGMAADPAALPPPDAPKAGNSSSSQGPMPPMSIELGYEALVREAEQRGEALA
jgi:hypothetical protein